MKIEEIKDRTLPIFVQYHIKRAGIFGSFAEGDEISLLKFVGIKHALEDVLGKKVDLVEYQAIKPRLRDRILAEEIRIYG